jgi:hypothetical protein
MFTGDPHSCIIFTGDAHGCIIFTGGVLWFAGFV